MNNLTQRILTGILAGSLSVAMIWWSQWGVLAFCGIVSVLGWREFVKLVSASSGTMTLVYGILFWVGGAWALVAEPSPGREEWLIYILFFSMFLFPLNAIPALFRKAGKNPAASVAFSVFGFLYCFLPMVFLFLLDGTKHHDWNNTIHVPEIPLGIIFLNWTLDTFAYFGGRLLGRHKLFERISPKKTWEGSIIGSMVCLLSGFILNKFWDQDFNWLVAAGIISVFSQFGDLIESMFKRSYRIKDSGVILPGHGGILDRFDGIYLSTPVVFMYIFLYT